MYLFLLSYTDIACTLEHPKPELVIQILRQITPGWHNCKDVALMDYPPLLSVYKD